MTSPNEGTASISEGSITESPPTGISFLGQEVNITAPAATADDPLTIVFEIDSSIVPAGEDESTIQISKGGVLVLNCLVFPGSTTASDDPCVSDRALLGDGDVEITVKTSTASPWNFGVSTPVVGVHDVKLRRIQSSFSVLGGVELDFRKIFVQVRNESDHVETVGVYLDVVPPGGISDPYGCVPNGRILQTAVSLNAFRTGGMQANVFADTGTLSDGLVEFSCADHAGAVGQTYTLIVALDVHVDDLAFCGPGDLQSDDCSDALSDDSDPSGEQVDERDAPRVQPPGTD